MSWFDFNQDLDNRGISPGAFWLLVIATWWLLLRGGIAIWLTR